VIFIIVLLGSGTEYSFSSFLTKSSVELLVFWGLGFPGLLLLSTLLISLLAEGKYSLSQGKVTEKREPHRENKRCAGFSQGFHRVLISVSVWATPGDLGRNGGRD
jgi:hypothetical protein